MPQATVRRKAGELISNRDFAGLPGKPPNPSAVTVILLCLTLGGLCLAFSYVLFHGIPGEMFSFSKNKFPVKGRVSCT